MQKLEFKQSSAKSSSYRQLTAAGFCHYTQAHNCRSPISFSFMTCNISSTVITKTFFWTKHSLSGNIVHALIFLPTGFFKIREHVCCHTSAHLKSYLPFAHIYHWARNKVLRKQISKNTIKFSRCNNPTE